MADFGGVTGLWIGASVVSMLEIFVLIYFMSKTYYVQKKKSSALAPPTITVNNTDSPLLVKPVLLVKQPSKESTKSAKSTSPEPDKHEKILLDFDSPTPPSRKSTLGFAPPPRKNTFGYVSPSRSPTPDPEMPNEENIMVEPESPPRSPSTPRSSSPPRSPSRRSSLPSRKNTYAYVPPNRDLPCVCLVNKEGKISKVNMFCPDHGFMARRGTVFSDDSSRKSSDNPHKTSSTFDDIEDESEESE